jgi:hypothetical protein
MMMGYTLAEDEDLDLGYKVAVDCLLVCCARQGEEDHRFLDSDLEDACMHLPGMSVTPPFKTIAQATWIFPPFVTIFCKL